jgi:hypothetical protein
MRSSTSRSLGRPTTNHATPVADPEIHRLRRGNKYAAAHYFRMILANDDRPRTMHAEAERTEGHLLPRLSQTCSTATNIAAPTDENPGAAPPPTNESPKHTPAQKHPNATSASPTTAWNSDPALCDCLIG